VHIAGRLALQSDWASSNVASSEHISAKFGYHGCDIVVREICERSFLADFVDEQCSRGSKNPSTANYLPAL
jgi:hypothetical protein